MLINGLERKKYGIQGCAIIAITKRQSARAGVWDITEVVYRTLVSRGSRWWLNSTVKSKRTESLRNETRTMLPRCRQHHSADIWDRTAWVKTNTLVQLGDSVTEIEWQLGRGRVSAAKQSS